MKFLLALALSLVSLQVMAFPYTKSLFCQSYDEHHGDFSLIVEAKVTDAHNYEVTLLNQYYYPLPVYSKEIVFGEAGQMLEIKTSAHVELFHIINIGGSWMGEYWFDMVNYKLSCIETTL